MALLAPPQRLQADVVFIRSFAEIEEPFEAVESALLGPPQTRLTEADRDGTSEPVLCLGPLNVL